MPRYRVFYLKDRQANAYRQAGPKTQPYRLKRSDYSEGPAVEASSPYAAWKQLEEGDEGPSRKLVIGDVLEIDPSSVMVMNFWGFDEAQWQDSDPVSSPGPEPDAQAESDGETVETKGNGT